MKFPNLIILWIMIMSCLVHGLPHARGIGWAKTDQSHLTQNDKTTITLALLRPADLPAPKEEPKPEPKKHRAPPALDPPTRTPGDRTPGTIHRAPPAPGPPKGHRAPPAPDHHKKHRAPPAP
jgi:hypothetical protein